MKGTAGNTDKMPDFKQAKEKILGADRIAIAGHINPDGDSIGSLLSLGLGIEKLGKRVYMISADGVPKKYRFLPGASRILSEIKEPVDLAVAVDCSNKELLGEAYGVFRSASDILEIDHHEFRRPFGNTFLIDKKAAAVGELVYLLLKELNIPLEMKIAQSILTSIIIETDSFRLPSVRALTFEICRNLMEAGAGFYKLIDRFFWSETRESVILSGICLSRCKFLKNERLVWSIIRKKDFLSVKGSDEDVDAVADQMRSIEGVEIAVLFREKSKESLRVSLRSKGKINIGSIAEYYKGGGHFDVAGCLIANNPAAVKELLSGAKGLL